MRKVDVSGNYMMRSSNSFLYDFPSGMRGHEAERDFDVGDSNNNIACGDLLSAALARMKKSNSSKDNE